MKLISWNVNGLRAIVKKDFASIFNELDADFFCIQETKLQANQIDLTFPGYTSYFNYADKKGYSGTAIYTKHQPLNVTTGIGIDEFDHEGRVLTLEYPNFYLVNCYIPNAQPQLKRLDFRLAFNDAFQTYLTNLKAQKHVIVCGDFNVAHTKIDLKNWKTNQQNAGFSPNERAKFSKLLESGFIDTFRYFYPDKTGIYSWWSYRFNARANNAGWRIDYFLVSDDLKPKLQNANILTDIMGSDHCPIELELDLEAN